MQQSLFKARDKRNKGWFWLDNEYLNGYAKHFGAVGTAIYVSLCRHANNENQQCFPAQTLIAEELNIGRNTVAKYIKIFEKWNIISIQKERDYRTKKWLNNVYYLIDKTEWKKPCTTGEHGLSHAQLVNEPCTTGDKSHAQPLCNKETNINKTHMKKQNSEADASPPLNETINLFQPLNPLTYKKWFTNKTQRSAVERLFKLLGCEKIKLAIEAAAKVQSMKFAPIISTPLQLEDKLNDLRNFIIKEKQNSKWHII